MANVDSTSHVDSGRKQAGLPDVPNIDGRPIWEPPIFDYSDLIGEEYEKKREAAWKYTGGDVVKTTAIMDLTTEHALIVDYSRWSNSNRDGANTPSDQFFAALTRELSVDSNEISDAPRDDNGDRLHEIEFEKLEDGTYLAMSRYDHKAMMELRAELREISNAVRPSKLQYGYDTSRSCIYSDDENHPIAVRMRHMRGMGGWKCDDPTCEHCLQYCIDRDSVD